MLEECQVASIRVQGLSKGTWTSHFKRKTTLINLEVEMKGLTWVTVRVPFKRKELTYHSTSNQAATPSTMLLSKKTKD